MKTKVILSFGICLIILTSIDIYKDYKKEVFIKQIKQSFIDNNISLNDPDVQIILLRIK